VLNPALSCYAVLNAVASAVHTLGMPDKADFPSRLLQEVTHVGMYACMIFRILQCGNNGTWQKLSISIRKETN
jgi:hypothetical protein